MPPPEAILVVGHRRNNVAMPLSLSAPPVPADWSAHTPVTDPGRFSALLDAIPPDPASIGLAARNVIAHYRAEAAHLPESSRDDINLRWLSEQLATDQARHGCTLDVDRPLAQRLQGCCRDHSLFGVGVLRQHGIPARSRVGFAGYFMPNWHPDHVIVEYWDVDRWRRFDPEVDPAWHLLPDPLDMEAGADAPFQTAAEVYTLMRAGDLDPATYGVAPDSPFAGERFVVGEVFYELAHRYGDETLLWDSWGAMDDPGRDGLTEMVDGIAGLLIAADGGDTAAESALYQRYLVDDGLHPGASVTQFSPYGEPPLTVALRP